MLLRQNGKQRCLTLEDHAVALRFRDLVDQVGADRAQEIAAVDRRERRTTTVQAWVTHHIDRLSGVDVRTVADYRGYVRTGIGPAFGEMPLAAQSRADVARWVQDVHTAKGSSA